MSSISGASRAQGSRRAKAKPGPKAKTQSKTRSKRARSKNGQSKAKADAEVGGEHGAGPDPGARSHLLAVRDELDELAAMVAVLPQLQRFVAVMEEIISQRSSYRFAQDHISIAITELPRKQQAAAIKALDNFTSQDRVADPELMDMKSGLEAMMRCIECRLHRVCCLLAVA